MNILLIGGTGFIGPYVARRFAEAGHRVTVFHRGQREPELPASVRHVHSLDAAIPVCNFPAELFNPDPEIIIHMNAMGETDTRAAVQTFRRRTKRIVWLSSGDVYRAYGRFTRIEPGPIESGLLSEESPLRTLLYPYRKKAQSPESLEFFYEKILVEGIAMSDNALESTVLRLPKVYGPESNADLATVYRYRHHPHWRWTHGYVENVAAAIVLAALHPSAAGRIYNIGEEYTPTIAERLGTLPESVLTPDSTSDFDFEQDIAYDTSRNRNELGYREPVTYDEGLKRTLSNVGSRYS